jgi:hypothetical protein
MARTHVLRGSVQLPKQDTGMKYGLRGQKWRAISNPTVPNVSGARIPGQCTTRSGTAEKSQKCVFWQVVKEKENKKFCEAAGL